RVATAAVSAAAVIPAKRYSSTPLLALSVPEYRFAEQLGQSLVGHACVACPPSSSGGVGSAIVGSDDRSRRWMRSAAVGAAASCDGGVDSTVVESSFNRTILGSDVGWEV